VATHRTFPGEFDVASRRRYVTQATKQPTTTSVKCSPDPFVVVKTNPGYLPNPGHKGTGKLVVIVCKT
jgi:hypothetical protein